MSFVSYSLVNDRLFQVSIDKAFVEVKNLKQPFTAIAKDFYKSQRAIFELTTSGKYPDFKGEKKNGLTKYQSYKISKNYQGVNGSGYPLLKATGKLERSVTDPSSSFAILEIEKTFLKIGTSVPYANYHQQDNPDLGNRKMPTRKFLFIGPESKFANDDQRGRLDRWTKTINSYVLKVMKRQLEKKNV